MVLMSCTFPWTTVSFNSCWTICKPQLLQGLLASDTKHRGLVSLHHQDCCVADPAAASRLTQICISRTVHT